MITSWMGRLTFTEIDSVPWIAASMRSCDQPGWSRDRIDRAIQGTETISVKIERPIQVVIMYATAAVMQNGEVHFFEDIYGEDRALEKELVTQ